VLVNRSAAKDQVSDIQHKSQELEVELNKARLANEHLKQELERKVQHTACPAVAML